MSSMKDRSNVRYSGGRGNFSGLARNVLNAGVAVFANASVSVKVTTTTTTTITTSTRTPTDPELSVFSVRH